MKIAHLLLTSSFAGTERHVIGLADAQARAGHEVTVILHERSREQRPDAFADRFDPAIRRVFVRGWKHFFLPGAARRELLALKPDVAHAHLNGGCAALDGLRAPFPRLATLHIRYKPRQHADMDGLIAIAPWQMDTLPPALRARSTQIDNWVQPLEAAADARERLRREFGIGPDDYVIGALGRADESKGLDVLVRAFEAAWLPKDVRLVIVGDGKAWPALRALAPGEVVMPGFAPRPQDWFACFDTFVSAARDEPFGLVFLEAMSAGLPVLASDSEGGRHFAALIGRPLVPRGDVDAMAAALRRLADERPARRAYDLAPFSQAARVQDVMRYYERLIAEAGAKAA